MTPTQKRNFIIQNKKRLQIWRKLTTAERYSLARSKVIADLWSMNRHCSDRYR